MFKKEDFKIKLIFPWIFEKENQFSISPRYYLPYGMGVVTGFLRMQGYRVGIEDFDFEAKRSKDYLPVTRLMRRMSIPQFDEEIYRILRAGNFKNSLGILIERLLSSTSLDGFNLIGFSVLSYKSLLFALLLSKKIKQNTNTPIVLGGPFITLYGHLFPKIFNFIDYLIVGDGSVPLLKLIQSLQGKFDIADVPNLAYKDNDKVITNSRECYAIEDIPMPDFDGWPVQLCESLKSSLVLPYQTTRGCIGKCSFCANRDVNGKLEFKSYEKIVSELWQMKQKYKSRIFYFRDDIINGSYEYLDELCDVFIKNKLDILWTVYAKVGNLDEYILRKMKKAGCFCLNFGIESGSDKILKLMNKGFTSEEASRTMREAYGAGIKSSVLLIIGFPHETEEDFSQTKEFIKRNRKYINYLSYNLFTLFYGSEVFCNPEAYGITNLSPTRARHYIAYEESDGLAWEQILEKQKDRKRRIVRAIWNHVLSKILVDRAIFYPSPVLLKLKEYVLRFFADRWRINRAH